MAEWIDYHRKIEVKKFYIYDNDSTIPAKETLASLIREKVVVVEKMAGRIKQLETYVHCLKHYGKKTQWMIFKKLKLLPDLFIAENINCHIKSFTDQYFISKWTIQNS
ncbi:glycosyltransferase family 2 protein [Arcticibacter svalbardensis]|uniref:glycosyltransferase family 2 protein n=1 Tax=Arcticibacter svalbardensis TaxID=1288027 RepID=UPI0009FD2498